MIVRSRNMKKHGVLQTLDQIRVGGYIIYDDRRCLIYHRQISAWPMIRRPLTLTWNSCRQTSHTEQSSDNRLLAGNTEDKPAQPPNIHDSTSVVCYPTLLASLPNLEGLVSKFFMVTNFPYRGKAYIIG